MHCGYGENDSLLVVFCQSIIVSVPCHIENKVETISLYDFMDIIKVIAVAITILFPVELGGV